MSAPADSQRPVFFFVPHTHWEGAVFKSRDEYLEMGLPNILRALRLLEEHPHYRFTLDQVCYVKPFLERYPHEAAAFRRFVDEGRLAIVGGTDVMLDVNMPGGESFARQVLLGKGYFRDALGVDVTVGWQLDTFGHHAQMPQLLKLAGYRSYWFFRGVPSWDTPAELDWQGLDGTRVPAYWLPHGYALTYGSPADADEFAAFMAERFARLDPFACGPARVGLAGADVCAPEEHVPGLVEEFNARADAAFELRLATPVEYEAWVEANPPTPEPGAPGSALGQRLPDASDPPLPAEARPSTAADPLASRPVLHGELNPIFQGIYSSRIELKQLTRQIESDLLTAEKLGVALRCRDLPVDDEVLWRAWEPTLFNQAHDLMSGVMTDHVYADTLASYDRARRLARQQVDERLRHYAAAVDTCGDGVPVVVYNPLGWTRTDVVEATVGFGSARPVGLHLTGSAGEPVPFQVIEAVRDGRGRLLQARLAFLACDVPALGHCVYHLVPADAALPEPAPAPAGTAGVTLAGEHARVAVDAWGALTSVERAADGWQALAGPANVVAREPDRGDLWELYRPLDGGSRIAMQQPHGIPAGDGVDFTNRGAAPEGAVRRGPVYEEYEVNGPFGAAGQFGTRVRVYAGLPRIDIRTRLRNEDEFVRYRALFPTSIRGGTAFHEIPFGALERPAGIEFPAQNWVDYGDEAHGLTLVNRGLPGHNVADDTLLLSLCRSSRIVAYGYGGGYEPGMSSDSGLELGKELVFEYALVPHAGNWLQARAWRHGLGLNHPLRACVAAPGPGGLPPRWGLLDIDHPHVVVSALKPARDGRAVLRVYDAGGQGAEGAALRLSAPVAAAWTADLLEDPVAPAAIHGQTLRLDLRPWEIVTLKLAL